MPAYQPLSAKIIYAGESEAAFSAETPTPGTGAAAASQAFALNDGPNENLGFSVQGQFSGAPGAFEIDVMVAENNSAFANYTQLATITTVDTNQNFRYDATVNPSLVCLLLKTRTNAVSVTAYVKKN